MKVSTFEDGFEVDLTNREFEKGTQVPTPLHYEVVQCFIEVCGLECHHLFRDTSLKH